MTIVVRALQWLIDRLTVSYQKLDDDDPLVTSTRPEDKAPKR